MADLEANAATLQAMLGMATLAEAHSFLEMAGGDLQQATQLFFELGAQAQGSPSGGGVAAAMATEADAAGAGCLEPWAPWCEVLLGRQPVPVPESWAAQALVLASDGVEHGGSGLVQTGNGPCGVLAALQAGLLASALRETGLPTTLPAVEALATPARLLDTVAHIITRCRQASPCKNGGCQMALWEGGAAGERRRVGFTPVDDAAVGQLLRDNAEAYTGPGCLLLILASCIETRSAGLVLADMAADNGEPPLIAGPNALCSFELMSLMLRGSAHGNVFAYAAGGVFNDSWRDCDVGLLSIAERESGAPIANGLSSPRLPVYILHGGDHFTVMLCEEAVPDDRTTAFAAWHWNGLPPAGPRMTRLEILPPRGARKPAPPELVESFVKPRPGEIEDVVQASPDDKRARPKAWQSWSYEVVLAVDDPSVQGIEDPTRDEPLYAQGEPGPGPWRCAACYAKRYETMCFGLNDSGAPACRHCNKPRAECGWSLWMPHAELSPRWRAAMAARFGPKISALLARKWPRAEVRFAPADEPSV